MVSQNRNRKTKTEALDLDVLKRLNVLRLELANMGSGHRLAKMPTYSDCVKYLLDKEGF